jgi:hypothetical protein
MAALAARPRAVHGVLVAPVTLSVASVVLETVPSFAAEYGSIFLAVEYLAVAVFSVEYLLRICCAPEHTLYAGFGPIAARWTFFALALGADRSRHAAADLRFFLHCSGPAHPAVSAYPALP